jgi:fatty acid desaturase
MMAMALHFVVYFGTIFALMPFWQAILFMLVHHLVAGLYMGSVFAPNHKGMLVPDPADPIDPFRRQVLTSRNIAPHPLADIWYGGLNYQIEHHLFPMIPRNNLKTARSVVKAYCIERGISYHETTMWQSYKEISQYLQAIARSVYVNEPLQEELRHPVGP